MTSADYKYAGPAYDGLVPAGDENRILIVYLAVSMVLFAWPLIYVAELRYPHAWVSAHFLTMARNFANFGVLQLGLVPIHNGGPITGEPDYYIHWPPLFPIFLSWIVALWGQASVTMLHATSLALVALQAALILLWVRKIHSTFAALGAALVFLNLPIIAKFAHAGLHLHLALLLNLAAVLAFDLTARRKTDARWMFPAGVACFAMACFTSWEPVLALPGLALYWISQRSWRAVRLIAAYGAAWVGSIAITFYLYFLKVPDVVSELLTRAMQRAGLYAPGSIEPQSSEPIWVTVLSTAPQHLAQIGIFGLAAILAVLLLVMRPSKMPRSWAGPALALAPLMSMAVLWIALMPQHFAVHSYQTIVFALPAAMSAGLLFAFAGESAKVIVGNPDLVAYRSRRLLVLLGLFVIAARIEVDFERFRYYHGDDDHVLLGKTLAREVPNNGIVAVPWQNMVPTYYSNRHLVLGIGDHTMFESFRDQIERICPACPLFLVLSRHQTSAPELPYPTIWQGDDWRIVRIRDAALETRPPGNADNHD